RVSEQPFAKTTVWVRESVLRNSNFHEAAILTVLGEGPVAVSETRQPGMPGLPLGHSLEALLDGPANSPAAAATAATSVAIAPNRLFISPPSRGLFPGG